MKNSPIFCFFAIILAASSGVDLRKLPEQIGAALGIGTAGGQILLSAIVMMTLLLPGLVFASKNMMVHGIMGLLGLAFLLVIGWLPIWLFIIVILLLSIMWAQVLMGIWKSRGGGDQYGD